jgi:hypothetical protein
VWAFKKRQPILAYLYQQVFSVGANVATEFQITPLVALPIYVVFIEGKRRHCSSRLVVAGTVDNVVRGPATNTRPAGITHSDKAIEIALSQSALCFLVIKFILPLRLGVILLLFLGLLLLVVCYRTLPITYNLRELSWREFLFACEKFAGLLLRHLITFLHLTQCLTELKITT